MSYDPQQNPQYTRPFSGPPQQVPYQPGQPHVYGADPGWQAPLPPVKKRRWPVILGVFAAVVVAMCLFGAAISNFSDKSDTSGAAIAPATGGAGKKSAAGMNEAVRDGKFQFTVTDMDCSKSTLGSEFLKQDAQGVFCVITVNVANIGKEAQSFDGSSQKVFDAKGVQYSNDSGAEFYANDSSTTFFEQINPGNQVNGRLVFDVPEGTKLTAMELHDSAFSGGVKVNLK